MSNPEKKPNHASNYLVFFAVIVVLGLGYLLTVGVPLNEPLIRAQIAKLDPDDHDGIVRLNTKLLAVAPEDKAAPTEIERSKRQLEILAGFNGPKGSHIELEKVIKSAMNDPESYEHISTTYTDKEDFLIVVTEYRGKNAFGGKVPGTVTAAVTVSGIVIKIY